MSVAGLSFETAMRRTCDFALVCEVKVEAGMAGVGYLFPGLVRRIDA